MAPRKKPPLASLSPLISLGRTADSKRLPPEDHSTAQLNVLLGL